MVTLNPQSSTPLVLQIVASFCAAIEDGSLRPGAKAPSIRQFAHAHNVSVFTVVDAYDRLVAQGYFTSRPHAGFFVRQRPASSAALSGHSPNFSFDSMWYLRRIFENRALRMKPGCGWLPGDWLFQEGMRRSLRSLATQDVDLGGYGEPKGYPPLRQLVRDLLAEQEIAVTSEHVLLTQGSSQAMDLVARRLVRPGDAVLVDDPGYPNLLFSLRFLGAKLIGVPRTPMGYDLLALERLVVEHRPKLFFTQPRLQSPTGSIAQLSHLHRVMQLADKHDFLVVENDIYADLDPEPRPSLASLDQLSRVIYISSFSKTISPNIRVGYLAASPDLLEDLAQLKMISGLTSSEFSERLAYGALTDGRWRKHVKSVRERLAKAHLGAAARLLKVGFEIFCEPKAGIFLWAKHPAIADSAELAYKAAEQDILLGPGHLFSPNLQPSPWLRFNVVFCDEPALFDFLAAQCQTT
ncbi:MAG: PLP-dependent aminotransferase family protein [Gammaproteobacteria bacterium]|uniref:aminotransferase-like domain-containing protein n=1 Tax=Rhodoferax sp. TaxID=50421 RepID=UPI0017B682D2|nr:PLP-dependent aminotransferase family protein [Rhodoferax sp.]MBU3900426.1 PLP-dependent aminotransferase family protein [Gammaproteobacteria bacterium]MBA3059657.1 PLP-dependent aminotransferase family protein [Rhodoferax sp.]MBU3998437.1 PLP-dependent aminotransferase family protein [Gammaproteobacteria bacterium]MBU4082314.1 PLP-dependent aminotransferase family protein [Gammaproteobacteria bacterium]MBU4112721.1 PLP-dependent aminotransferase family protein [Gammaproteobacteria bacteriu